jgi:alkylhydroperoxidase family enzyme
MSRIPLSTVGSTPLERVMGHAPHVLTPWLQLEDAFYSRQILPADLLEQVRRTLALGHGCQYCQAYAGPPDASHSDLRTSVAVAFAQLFAQDHQGIGESQLAVMRQHFSDAELVELVSFMGFMWATGTFGSVLGVKAREAYAGDN